MKAGWAARAFAGIARARLVGEVGGALGSE